MTSMTLKSQSHDLNTLRAQYVDYSWRRISDNRQLLDSLLRGCTVGYPSDSLASCLNCIQVLISQ